MKGGRMVDPCNSLDPHAWCRACGKLGIRYRNRTGLCMECYRTLPVMAKATGTTVAIRMLAITAAVFVEVHGKMLAAELLDIDRELLDVMLRRELVLEAGGAPPLADLSASASDHLIKMLLRGGLQPLCPLATALVAPWRQALLQEAAAEPKHLASRRRRRQEARADVWQWVPPLDAPTSEVVVGNIYGRYSEVGRSRIPLPLRICAGLWGLGFSARAVERISIRVGRRMPYRAVARMMSGLASARPRAQRVRAGAVAAELGIRPLWVGEWDELSGGMS
jgi:hypothetical protein